MSTSLNFPVHWDDPADAEYAWTLERMHAPGPMTLADALAFNCAFDHGVTSAARAYGVPLRAETRRINTYLYLAILPTTWPTVAEGRLETAIGRLSALWEDEYLPEVKRHLQDWEAFDPAGADLSQLMHALDEGVERTRRLYEIHFLIWLPFMAAISLFDDFYRELFGGAADFDAYRLLQGFANKTTEGGRALWQLSRQALQLPSVRGVLEHAPAESVLTQLEDVPADPRSWPGCANTWRPGVSAAIVWAGVSPAGSRTPRRSSRR